MDKARSTFAAAAAGLLAFEKLFNTTISSSESIFFNRQQWQTRTSVRSLAILALRWPRWPSVALFFCVLFISSSDTTESFTTSEYLAQEHNNECCTAALHATWRCRAQPQRLHTQCYWVECPWSLHVPISLMRSTIPMVPRSSPAPAGDSNVATTPIPRYRY